MTISYLSGASGLVRAGLICVATWGLVSVHCGSSDDAAKPARKLLVSLGDGLCSGLVKVGGGLYARCEAGDDTSILRVDLASNDLSTIRTLTEASIWGMRGDETHLFYAGTTDTEGSVFGRT